jgi:hypothetical protein
VPDYAWVCHKCQAPNRAGASSCEHCGFQAIASGVEIEAARTGKKITPPQSRKAFLKTRREELVALPLWKKPFAYALRFLQFIGSVIAWLAIFDLSLSGVLVGIALAIASELVFQLLKGKPYAWQTS